jgi:hypothetical protein
MEVFSYGKKKNNEDFVINSFHNNAITQKLRSADKGFLCTALRVIERSMHTMSGVNPTYTD